MSQHPDTDPLRDERLTRLGREWFADVRRRHPDEEAERKTRKDGSGDGDDGGLLDWLLGGDDADGGDASGD